MTLDDIIYLENLPSIDLHGLDRDTARVKVEDFIKDNKTMKNSIVCIVHGVGSGILKNEIHSYLRTNRLVEDYKLFYNNSGCTIVKIRIK